MAAPYASLKKYTNFYGIDLKSNDLAPEDPFSAVSDNLTTGQIGTLEKRIGYHPTANDSGPLGMFVYNRINPATGIEEPEILSVSNELKKLKESVLSVTYTGTGTDVVFSLVYNPTAQEYQVKITEVASSVTEFGPISLGVGLDDPSPVTIANLVTAINALAGPFTASASGDTSVPACYIENVYEKSFFSTALSINAHYWETVDSPGTVAPFAGLHAKLDSVDFEPISSVQAQNSIFFSSGYDTLKKYDGQNCYRAGVPEVVQVSGFPIGDSLSTGAITGTKYQYRIQYIQKDANGVLVEGNAIFYPAQGAALIDAAAEQITLSNIPTVVQSSGFNVNAAVVSIGTGGSPATLIQATGHTLKVGDTAYLFDRADSTYKEIKVIAPVVAGTSFTLASGAELNAGDVISNNLRIAIWRNESSGTEPTIWYQVAEIPNNPFVTTVSYTDNTPDAGLGVEFIEPVTDRSPPKSYKYLTLFQGLMIGAGTLEDKNKLSWSDIENAEYWPDPSNTAIIKSIDGDRITAVASSNDILALFQSRAIYVLSGDVVSGAFRVEQLTNDIGCIAHQSIRDIRGSLFFLSSLGPRVMSGGQIPRALGAFGANQLVSRIDPIFVQGYATEQDVKLQTQRSWAFHDRQGQKYWLFIPVESVEGSIRYCNPSSQILVYDYSRDSWMTWKEMNTAAGVVSLNNEIFFAERGISDDGLSRRTTLYRQHTTGTRFDYQDHVSPILGKFVSKWDFIGEASLLKNFISFRLWAVEQVDSEFTLKISSELNFVSDTPVSQFSLTIGSSGYGELEYGNDPYGDPVVTNLKHKLSNGRAKSIRIIMENNQDQTNIVVTGYELEIAAPYKLGFKS